MNILVTADPFFRPLSCFSISIIFSLTAEYTLKLLNCETSRLRQEVICYHITMEQYRFSGQKSGEVVIGVFRKSLIAYIQDFGLVILAIVLFFIIGKYVSFLLTFYHSLLVGCLLALCILVRAWYLWANTLVLVTSLRIISLNQEGIFKRDIKEAYITEVSQVVASVDGILQSLFGYGDITITTYGELTLKDVKDPYAAKEAIYDAAHASKKSVATGDEKFWEAEKQGK